MNKFEQFANENIASNEEISDLSLLCHTLANKDFEYELLLQKAEELLKEIEKLRYEVIPTKLAELGMKSLELDTGEKLSIKKQYFANINNDNKEKAYEWLRANGHGGIIKNTLTIELSKGMDERVKKVINILKENEINNIVQKEDINGQTLKAWAKEQCEKGAKLPEEIKVYERSKVEIK